MNVHQIHYQANDSELERAKIAKILLLQDAGIAGQFIGKSLEDINLEGKQNFNSTTINTVTLLTFAAGVFQCR